MTIGPGSRLDRYEILAEIGVGGMGVIYRGWDTERARPVALKIMAPHLAADPLMRRRFENEARAVGALSHPGFPSVFEVGSAGGTPFVVMELLEGQNLRDRIRSGVLPLRDALLIAASIAEALAAAHVRGIVHRDIKPENIFLTGDGHVKILDFGLALLCGGRDVDEAARARQYERGALGTFGYMSPEQVAGAEVDGRTDVFALGCLLYESLCGHQLFVASTPQEFFAKLAADTPLDLGAVGPIASPAVRAIVSRAVERNPARRFSSAQEFGEALRIVLAGLAPAVPPSAGGCPPTL